MGRVRRSRTFQTAVGGGFGGCAGCFLFAVFLAVATLALIYARRRGWF